MQSSLVRIPSTLYTYSFESYWVWSCMFNSHHISSISTDFFGLPKVDTSNRQTTQLHEDCFLGFSTVVGLRDQRPGTSAGGWILRSKTWIFWMIINGTQTVANVWDDFNLQKYFEMGSFQNGRTFVHQMWWCQPTSCPLHFWTQNKHLGLRSYTNLIWSRKSFGIVDKSAKSLQDSGSYSQLLGTGWGHRS